MSLCATTPIASRGVGAHTHTHAQTYLADSTVSHYDAWDVSVRTLRGTPPRRSCLHLMLRVAAMMGGAAGGVDGERMEKGQ